MAQEQETEKDIGELENRLERLRILYEQYFMGIEKREPGVQHKDVERRLQQLRKTRFHSTAARFKFQTMLQRFNTLQQYWTRTCREIENGTYKRHLKRAARRLATAPPPGAPHDGVQGDAAQREKVREAAAADLGALLSKDVDLEEEMAGALAALGKSPAPNPKEPLGPSRTPGALGPAKDGPRAYTSPTLHLGKATPLKSLTPEGKPSISSRLSTSPKPAGLAPLKQPATGSSLTLPRKGTPTAPVVVPQKAAPPPAAKVASTPAQAARAVAPGRGAPPVSPQVKRPEAPSQADAGLSAERIKALHNSYVEARKKTNASPVSYEKLEKNIRDTEQKLRTQHQGRKVDFEVAIKDGKAILKPRLK